MDLIKIFSEIEKIDGEVYERFDTRRRVFQHLAGLGKAVTATTTPALLSTMFNKAYGQGSTALTADMKAVLNLALQLEYLEFHFYDTALKTAGLIPAANRPAFEIIRDDERGHINALSAVLAADAFPDPTVPAFDYTAGGKLLPFSSFAVFLGAAQVFEDLGVRAYKGGAPGLMANKDILTAALNIHSVEARHSSHMRSLRRGGFAVPGEMAGGAGNARPKSWVGLREFGGPVPDVTAPVYGPGTNVNFPAEDNVTQGGVNVQATTTYPTIAGSTFSDAMKQAAASESFDEPLDGDTVKRIARSFRSPVGVTKGLFA